MKRSTLVGLAITGVLFCHTGETAVQNPEFIAASEAFFLEDDELVLGVALENPQATAYPIRVLGLYEVINDRVGEKAISATW